MEIDIRKFSRVLETDKDTLKPRCIVTCSCKNCSEKTYFLGPRSPTNQKNVNSSRKSVKDVIPESKLAQCYGNFYYDDVRLFNILCRYYIFYYSILFYFVLSQGILVYVLLARMDDLVQSIHLDLYTHHTFVLLLGKIAIGSLMMTTFVHALKLLKVLKIQT